MTIPVDTGTDAGSLVTTRGQVQYGPMLLGGGTSAGWVNLTGWRDLPSGDVADSLRPQAHGAYPGSVLAQSLTITYDLLLRGTPEDKLADLAILEGYTRMDGVERPLVVDDGAGPTVRMARVVQRAIPMDKAYRHGPLACSVQWVCADPRRYGLDPITVALATPSSVGGLVYPLVYPLDYGTTVGGSAGLSVTGFEPAPLVAVFTGPMVSPRLSCPSAGWRLEFDLTLAASEQLVVDTGAGTALLAGADRLYALTSDSDPLEGCLLPPGGTALNLGATSGAGTATVTYRPTYL